MVAVAKCAAVCQSSLIAGVVPVAGGISLLLNGIKGENDFISAQLVSFFHVSSCPDHTKQYSAFVPVNSLGEILRNVCDLLEYSSDTYTSK